jgi:hypothetical protein
MLAARHESLPEIDEVYTVRAGGRFTALLTCFAGAGYASDPFFHGGRYIVANTIRIVL